MQLDSEEKEILEAFIAGTLQQSATAAQDMASAPLIAHATRLNDAHQLNLALKKADIDLLTIRACPETNV